MQRTKCKKNHLNQSVVYEIYDTRSEINVVDVFIIQIKCRMFMDSDSPTDAILRLAKEKHADHIVMGSRGRDPISRALFGSVSYFCTHHSEVPVSVVPPGIPDMDEVPPPLPPFTDNKDLYENNLGYI